MIDNNKITAIFNDAISAGPLRQIEMKHTGLVHDFSNKEEFKAARKVNTEMNKLLERVDRVGIDAAAQIAEERKNLKSRIEDAYSGTVTPYLIENQKRKDEKKRLEDEKAARLLEQRSKLDMMKRASARALYLPIDGIEEILQTVMEIDISSFDVDMQSNAQIAKDISLAQLNDAFKYATEKEENRKEAEIKDAELADKNDEIAKLTAQLTALQPDPKANEVEEATYNLLPRDFILWGGKYSIDPIVFLELEKLINKHYRN